MNYLVIFSKSIFSLQGKDRWRLGTISAREPTISALSKFQPGFSACPSVTVATKNARLAVVCFLEISTCGMSYSDIDDVSANTIEEIIRGFQSITPSKGFEFHPFKIGWYNECVQKVFALPYSYDTLAVVVITTPSMFENYLLPYVQIERCKGIRDPIDECVASILNDIKKALPNYDIESIHDFELHPTRRPKVLVQTAGHVSGAAYYYQKSDVRNNPWEDSKKICGVSIHPKYGGWFALRGVMIFRNVLCSELQAKNPIDVVGSEEKIIELLEKFNNQWKDWSFRDIIPPEETYSQLQRTYFQTKPMDRKQLLIERLS